MNTERPTPTPLCMERIARTHLPATFFEADAVVTLAGTADILCMERIARTHLPATFFEADAVVTLAGTADIEKGVGSRKQAPVGTPARIFLHENCGGFLETSGQGWSGLLPTVVCVNP